MGRPQGQPRAGSDAARCDLRVADPRRASRPRRDGPRPARGQGDRRSHGRGPPRRGTCRRSCAPRRRRRQDMRVQAAEAQVRGDDPAVYDQAAGELAAEAARAGSGERGVRGMVRTRPRARGRSRARPRRELERRGDQVPGVDAAGEDEGAEPEPGPNPEPESEPSRNRSPKASRSRAGAGSEQSRRPADVSETGAGTGAEPELRAVVCLCLALGPQAGEQRVGLSKLRLGLLPRSDGSGCWAGRARLSTRAGPVSRGS